MRLFLFAALLLSWQSAPVAKHRLGEQDDSRKTNQEQQKITNSEPVVFISECLGCFQESAPAHQDENVNLYDPRTDRLYRWYLGATIAGVAGAVFGLFVLFLQTRHTGKQVSALTNAERAWITTELIFTADLPAPAPTKTRIILGSGDEGDSICLDIFFACRYDGHTPAWITEVHIHSRNLPEVPINPDFSEQGGDYVVPEMQPVAPGRDWKFRWDNLRCNGPEVAENTLLVYGFVKYRDVFSPERETRFAYYLRGRQLLRLPGAKYWEYNKYT